jgi:hypothetical protein
MAVNVDEIVSSVIPEPEQSTGAAEVGHQPGWKTAAQMRALHASIACDQRRTVAERFDD